MRPPSSCNFLSQPARFIEHKCKEAESNPQPVLQGATVGERRRLLWHGGGAESKDIPDHSLGENQARMTCPDCIHIACVGYVFSAHACVHCLSQVIACACMMYLECDGAADSNTFSMACVHCLLACMQLYRGDGGTLHDYELTGD